MPPTLEQNKIDENITLGIKRIKDLGFVMNESLFEPNKVAQVQFVQTLAYSLEASALLFTLRVFFHYDESTPTDKILLDITVQNSFEFIELKEYVEDRSVKNLPQNLLTAIVSLSVSHTRALLAKNTAGTVYQDTFLPIINPLEMAKAFFSTAFEKEESPKKNKALKKVPLKKKV